MYLRARESAAVLKILHVDDDRDFLELFSVIFSRFFHIDSVLTGEEALARLNEERFDAIVTDYEMPGISGLDLLRAATEKYPYTPVIFLTGQGNEEVAREAFVAGCIDYFTKDITSFAQKEKLVNSIANAVRLKKHEEQAGKMEEMLRLTFFSSQAAMAIVSLNADILQVNRKFCQILGYCQEDMEGMSIKDIDDPEHWEEDYESVRRLIMGEADKFEEERLLTHRDGHQIYCRISVNMVRDSSGRPLFCIPTIEDISRKREIEKALEKEKARAQSYLDVANVIMVALDRDGRVAMINKKGACILGLGEEEAVGRSWFDDFIPEPERAKLRSAYKEMMDSTNLHIEEFFDDAYENPVTARDGQERIIQWHNAFIKDEDGRVTGALSSGIDVTERIKIQEALRQNEERLSMALEAAQEGLWDWDSVTGEIYRSPRFYTMLGYEPGEIPPTYQGWKDLVHPDDIDEAKKNVREVLLKDLDFESEFRMKCRDGSYRWILSRGKAVKWDEKGNPVRFAGTHADIDRRKIAEEALNEREQSFQALARNIPGIIYRVFPRENNRMIFFNDMLKALTDYDEEELKMGEICSIDPLILPEDRKQVVETVKEAIENNEPFEVEYRIRHKDGSIRHLIERGRPVGNPLTIDGIILDVTSRKEIERELVAKNQELNDFAFRVSHDIKNTITVLGGYISILKTSPPDAEDIMSTMEKKIDSLFGFINRLLHLSRAGMVIGDKKPVNLEEIIRQICDSMDGFDGSVELVFETPLFDVPGDCAMMEEVFQNLLENSIKFRNPDNEKLIISVRLEKKGDYCVLTFRDNGLGMKEELISKVFNPGFTTSRDGGTGFGLPIARKIVEAHGGSIEARSDGPGRGTEFIMKIPLAQVGAANPSSS